MTYLSSLNPDLLFNPEVLTPDAVELTSEHIHQAAQLSLQIPDESRQWQTYLNGLAFFAFESWLQERASDLNLKRQNASIFQPALANSIEAVCHLEVNGFKICLVATGSLRDETVTLPRAVLDLPEYIAHFYVWVEIQEELDTALISGVLPYSTWVEHQATTPQHPQADWTYLIPLSWFAADQDQLLLYLRCLEPVAIALPAVPNRQGLLSRLQGGLKQALTQLQPAQLITQPLCQILTWEQNIAILTHPQLLNWVTQFQSEFRNTTSLEVLENWRTYLSDLMSLLTQPMINVGSWLRSQLDQVAQDLSWVLLPSPTLASPMRSTCEELTTLLQELQPQDETIPESSQGAYRDLRLGETALRLYALTWSMMSDSTPEWTLLLVLGTPTGSPLPPGVKLRVSDAIGILVEQGLGHGEIYPYLYTRIVGGWDERFLVTVSLSPDLQETLPPFGFNPH